MLFEWGEETEGDTYAEACEVDVEQFFGKKIVLRSQRCHGEGRSL